MGFFFLRMAIAAYASICCAFVVWHGLFWDEKTCVGALYVAYVLKELAELVGKAVLPHQSVFVVLDEVAIFEEVSCVIVNDSTDEVESVAGCGCGDNVGCAVRIFKKDACGGDVSVGGVRPGGFDVNHWHQGFGDCQVDEVNVIRAMLCSYAYPWGPGGGCSDVIIICNYDWGWEIVITGNDGCARFTCCVVDLGKSAWFPDLDMIVFVNDWRGKCGWWIDRYWIGWLFA
jgi:hypothetical protein